MKKIIFSGCGHLTPYHFGAAIYLHQQQQIMSSSNIVVAGVSGGALVAALLRFAPDKLNDVADYVCRTNKTLSGVLNELSGILLEGEGEEGLEVCVSRSSDGQLVRLSEHSNLNLEDALRAATHIPRDFHPFDLLSSKSSQYTSGYLYQHEHEYVDAGVCGHFMPFDEDTVFGISPFSLRSIKKVVVCCPENPNSTTTSKLTLPNSNIYLNLANLRRCQIAMFGGSEAALRSLLHNGYSDCARVFSSSSNLFFDAQN